MTPITTLNELFIYELRHLYDAERQVLETLPSWIEAATSFELEDLFADDLKHTLVRSQRIEEIGAELDFNIAGVRSKAMPGIIEKGNQAVYTTANENARDVALIATAQQIQHCQMAPYATATDFAKQLGYLYPMDLLKMSVDQIKDTYRRLTRLAEGGLIFSGLNEQAQI